MSRLALSFGALLLCFLLFEGALRVTSIFVTRGHDRSGRPSADDTVANTDFRILCVGDSNTYGLYVEREEAYPAQLERALRELETTVSVEVVNLGIPGTNSAQLLNRLPGYVERYDPDVLIVLIGVTDHWNPSEMNSIRGELADDGIRNWLWRSYALRFVLLAIENLAHRDPIPRTGVRVIPPRPPRDSAPRPADEVRWQTPARQSVSIDRDMHRERLARNLARIVRYARSEGIPLLLPTYAADQWHYRTANEAIRATRDAIIVPATFQAVLLAREPALAELPREALFFLPSQHPRPNVYRLFAAEVRDALLDHGLIPHSKQAPPEGASSVTSHDHEAGAIGGALVRMPGDAGE